MRLIDADALIDWARDDMQMHIDEYYERKSIEQEKKRFLAIKNAVDKAPTIDAFVVEHGEWIPINQQDDNGNDYYYCSICGKGELHEASTIVNYCWNCGSYMRGEE